MKKLPFIIGLFAAISGGAQPRLTTAVQGFHLPACDTVQPVRFVALDTSWKAGVWDFSNLQPEGEPIISYAKDTLNETILREGETLFRFDNQWDGNYYKGWKNDDKTVILHEAYNKLPLPFAVGQQYSASYSATGIFSHSVVITSIEGKYSIEAGADGKIILPDGRTICPVIRVKTIDHYRETNCNTTEVTIEKYLWYAPYYTFPVFVTAQTMYEYTGGIRDTLLSAYYTINPMPQPTIRSINDTTICIGKTVLLTASGEGQYYWRNLNENTDFSPFADTLLKPAITTSYVLMATYDLCAIEAAFDTVTITVIPQPEVRSINDTTICAEQKVLLTAIGIGDLSWRNITGNSAFSPFVDTVMTPAITTTYVLMAQNAPCVQPAFDTVTITVIPQPEVRSINDTTICAGQKVLLTATGIGDVSWCNITGNSVFLPFVDTVIIPTITTTYVLMAQNAPCLQPAFDTVTIIVKMPPDLLLHSNDTTICQGNIINLSASSEFPLQWCALDTYGQRIAINDLQVQPEVSTRYIAVASNPPCPDNMAAIAVTVLPIPKPEFTIIQSGNEVLFDITTPKIGGYNYIFNTGDFSTTAYNLFSILHKYWKRGTFDATLTITSNSNGCERSLLQKVIIEKDKPTDFILYPNPAGELITIIAPADILYYRIIRISTGAVWGESKRSGNETSLQIPVWQLQQGEYLIQVQTRDEWLSRIFIKLQ
jgi:hypothetical protein